ncbi:MAG: hypothetical protein AB8D52_06925 [Gammaproteobacteria bacterium]
MRSYSTAIKSILFSILLFASAPSAATLILDHGFSDTTTASGSSDLGSGNIKAEDFSLASSASLGSISWLGIYHGTNTPGNDNFNIGIFTDIGGLPDSSNRILNLNPGNAVNRASTNSQTGTASIFSYRADLATELPLLANTTYWLSIVNTFGTTTSNDWAWAASTTGGTAAFITLGDSTPTWAATNGTFQFQLNTTPVPIPAALWLFASGLLGLVGFRKKKTIS